MARHNGLKPSATFIYFSLYFFYFLQKSGGPGPPSKKVRGPRPPCSSIYETLIMQNQCVWLWKHSTWRSRKVHKTLVTFNVVFHFISFVKPKKMSAISKYMCDIYEAGSWNRMPEYCVCDIGPIHHLYIDIQCYSWHGICNCIISIGGAYERSHMYSTRIVI